MKFSIRKEQFDWWMENLGSPAGPLGWFKHWQAPAGAARWGTLTLSYLALIVWAVAFIWLWFAVFLVLFLYEGLGLAPWTRGEKLQSEKVKE